jgi:hypothetical protein
MKKIILLASIWSIALTLNAQQIGNGYTLAVENFNVPLLSGAHHTSVFQEGFPAAETGISTYLLTLRTTTHRNYQLQIASSFREDNRLFFRKIDIQSLSNADSSDKWHELATRGKNVFTDDQFLPFSKSIILGSAGTLSKRLRIQFIGNENQGDSYIDYGGNLYFRAASGTEYSYPVIGFTSNGNVMIGLPNSTVKKKLTVYGSVVAEDVLVKSNVWADFVFNDDYHLKPLSEVNAFIQENKHLPEIPSASEVKESEGVNLGEMQIKLLQKIEELTLYLIQQENTIQELKNEIRELKER